MSKQIKVLLKTAKQSIQEKKYGEALENCKELLSFDPSNYNGLVFTGLCNAELNQKEKSRSAYHDAIEVQKDQALAYQGLVNLYTKHWVTKLTVENTDDLIMAYENLKRLTSSKDKKKILDLYLGLAKAYSSNQAYSKSLAILQESIAQFDDSTTDLQLNSFYHEIINCFKLAKNSYVSLHEFSALFCLTLDYACEHANDLFDEVLRLFLIFHQSGNEFVSNDLNTMLSRILSIIRKNKSSPLLTQCAIQIHLQDANQLAAEELEAYLDSNLNHDEGLKKIYQGHVAYMTKQYQSCVELIESSVACFPDFLPFRLELAFAYLYMEKWDLAEKTARSCLQACKQLENIPMTENSTWLIKITSISSIKLNFMFILAKSLCHSESHEMLKVAIGTFEKLSKKWPDSVDVYLGVVKAHMSLKEHTQARKALDQVEMLDSNNPEMKSWKAYLTYEEGDKTAAIRGLEEIANKYPTCFLSHFLFAKVQWDFDESLRAKAFTSFLKVFLINSFQFETLTDIEAFCMLAKSSSKATRCFEKAFDLGPKNQNIGSALADQYVAEGNLQSAIDLYETVISGAPAGECKWARLRLGLCKLKNNEIEGAIKCLQAALRCDVNDHVSWECLGEAYLQRGSYSSAWKAFNKAHEIEPTSIYCIYQMAAIKQILSQFSEAVSEYIHVLEQSHDYVPALKGLGESHLSLAKEMLSEGRYLSCIDRVNEAVIHLAKAITARPDLSCVWKLLGDCLTIIHGLDASMVHISVPAQLLSNQSETRITKTEALKLGGKFYAQALRLHNSAALWHDFGLNYFYQAQSKEGEEACGLAAKAVQILQKGITLEPSNHILWNSLGIVSASRLVQNPALAQHSFIRSIQCEPNNVVAWSNLGSFYLERSKIDLAHKAFKVAQSLDPSFANCWIGQALVAESIGREESMDLFRHSTELGLHEQAAVGYGAWVCNMLSECYNNRHHYKYKENILELNAISAASVQLSKFCALHPDCERALSLYGFVLEESGLNLSAEEAYKQCLNLIAPDHCDNGAASSKLYEARKDYARILYKNKKFTESVDVYRSLPPHDYYAYCGLALSLYAVGNIEDANAAFHQALELAKPGREQSTCTIATAVLAWKQGRKSDVLERLQHHKSLNSLLCMCALGFLENDLELLKALLNNLGDYDVTNHNKYDVIYHECVVITAALSLVDLKKARSFVQKCIHRFPDDYRFHSLFHLLLTETSLAAYKLAVNSAQQSFINFAHDQRVLSTKSHLHKRSPLNYREQHESVWAAYTCALLAAGKIQNSGNEQPDMMKTAQRFIHCHPYSAKSWSTLSIAGYTEATLAKFAKVSTSKNLNLSKLSSFIVSQSHAELHAWAVKQSIFSSVLQQDFSEIDQLETNIPDTCDELLAVLSIYKSVRNMENNQRELNQAGGSSLQSVLLSSRALACKGDFAQAYSSLCNLRSDNKFARNKVKLCVCAASVAMHAADAQPSKSSDWLDKARDALNGAGNSPVVVLLQGLVEKKTKNYKRKPLM